ncbi:FAS1 domain-containing protein [Nannizzia gypsea CBS 118893]|uniref:FAS1 domain-containing protein n=1 Tax=Arthroderma gypseum (strain ATCC MYA-4604 / CBS 118893) TaxID=535722 RepID=E4UYI3_ARTGP|nr:FAS1 domain-containing protein [Nannizzia gypsea CBS 118893]EFR02146.1 FAS1 domain-containing protein [Nannizzia gypsea CBS 118893]
MKIVTLSTLLALTSLLVVCSSHWNPPILSRRRLLPRDYRSPKNLDPERDNIDRLNWSPLEDPDAVPHFVMPPSKEAARSSVRVSDILGKTREANIFASMTRDDENISNRLDNDSQDTIVLAPNNVAVQGLPHKPWENPSEYATFGVQNAYEGESGKKRANQNLEKFISAHLIPQGSWEAGKEIQTLGGGKIFWEEKDGKKYVANGEVWVINGVLNYL